MRRRAILLGLALAVTGGLLTLQAQTEKVPSTVVLKGSPLGGVKFDHTKHEKLSKNDCVSCHHESRPEKPNASPYQKCQDCHTTPAKPPMKTRAQFAFHDGPAKKGLCAGCHLEAAKNGAAAPQKCADCHKKENTGL